MTTTNNSKTAVLLMAHGSRRAEANEDLIRLAELIRQQSHYGFVEVSYLELAKPSIPAGVQQCVELGACSVLMMPYFLSAGSHVTADLERIRNEVADQFPAVEFKLCEPVGLHPLMVEIVLDRLKNAADS